MKSKKVFNFWRSPHIETAFDRVFWVIILLVRLSLVIAAIWSITLGDFITLGMSVLTLASSFVPTFVERYYDVRLPIEYHLIVVAFLYMSLFLGEVGGAYARFWWWDMVLHASSGIVLGYLGFLILYVLQARKKVNMSPFLIAFFSFCAAVTVGVFWEFFEFAMDQFFGLTMQHGNSDTMKDLIVDAIGAFIVAVFGYLFFRKQDGSPIESLVKDFMELNPRFRK